MPMPVNSSPNPYPNILNASNNPNPYAPSLFNNKPQPHIDNKPHIDFTARYRNYSFIFYPDSAPGGCLDGAIKYLESKSIPCYISPLHDRDIDETGNLVAPHYIGIFTFSGKTSIGRVFDYTKGLGCNVPPTPVPDLPTSVRYLAHMDQPDKAQYNPDEIICLNGANALKFFHTDENNKIALSDMMDFVKNRHIKTMDELMDYARSNNKFWFDLLCQTNGRTTMKSYIQSISQNDKFVLAEMMDCVKKNHIDSMGKLMDYAKNNNKFWFDLLCDYNSREMMSMYIHDTFDNDNQPKSMTITYN